MYFVTFGYFWSFWLWFLVGLSGSFWSFVQSLHVDGILHQGHIGHRHHAASNGGKQLPEANDGNHRHGQQGRVKLLGSGCLIHLQDGGK